MALAFALPAALWLQADVPLLTSLRVREESFLLKLQSWW